MILLYNLIQLFILALCWPVLLPVVLLLPKYRGQLPARLGFGLVDILQNVQKKKTSNQETFWVHALSVGEVNSSKPLIEKIRTTFPDAVIILSTTTVTGKKLAQQTLHASVDVFVSFPFDFYWCVARFIRLAAPDIFILIETDFWPNLLNILAKKQIPSLLANGRISRTSYNRYRSLCTLFTPLFSSFTFLAMQTREDAEKMTTLGVDQLKIKSIGNLKFDAALVQQESTSGPFTEIKQLRRNFLLPTEGTVLVAGSTHDGEERILLAIYKQLLDKKPDLFLVLAPRNPERGKEIATMAQEMGCTFSLRSEQEGNTSPQGISGLILDTIGELNRMYQAGNICFIGGSMVPAGGHNPLEPAAFGKPVLFGSHMEDFKEIAAALNASGGATLIHSEKELLDRLLFLLVHKNERLEQGKRAFTVVQAHQGAAQRCVDIIKEMLNPSNDKQ